MTGFFKDLRYAARSLRKDPGLSGIAVLALALGIGLTAVMFSIVYSALLRGLPYEDGERIVHVFRVNPEDGDLNSLPIHDYQALRDEQNAFTGLAAYYTGTVNLRGSERAVRLDGAFMTHQSFDLLGIQPVLGREFGPDDDQPDAPLTVVLGYELWESQYDADRDVLGRTVVVNGEQAEIIGVMPEEFAFPVVQEIWLPLRADALSVPWGEGRWHTVLGKLEGDRTREEAAAQLNVVAQRLEAEHPETNENMSLTVRPFTEAAIGDEASAMLLTMLLTVSLVLFIACLNVANLLLARASVRTREVAIRTAMGAHRWRVMSVMIAEALTLALAGAVVGTGIAWVGIEWFSAAVASTQPPFWLVFKLDGPILGFIIAVTGLAAVVAGAVPAWKATGASVSEVLKDESRGSSGLQIGRLSRALVVGELALSVGLLVAAGLMVKSVTTLASFDYGFDTEELFTARLGVFESEYPDSLDRIQFFQEVRDEIQALPEVRAASLATALPATGSGGTRLALDGRPYEENRDMPIARQAVVDPTYFRVLGVEPLLGRTFEAGDDGDGLPVALVNESFARSHYPDASPLGARVRLGGADSELPWRTVVGVVPDLYMQGVGNPGEPEDGLYIPLAQADGRFISILARGNGPSMSLTVPVRDAVARVDADVPLYWVGSLQSRIDESSWFYRIFGTLFMAFGVAALFLAAVGLYGVMSFSVSRRTPEVGIRMALGAEGGQVLGLILRQGMAQVALGITLGLVLAFFLSRALGLLLFQVSPNDPTVFGAIVVLLGLTGLLASVIPARRATRVDPMVALRSE